ncbi:MAG TPA: HlyD family efflux transporter periplasmic adaptor subunit [Clostridia bacterium]|nr:HlyD family efflux transporter periplasmic adaptor subunit [Clostridia bacterium]
MKRKYVYTIIAVVLIVGLVTFYFVNKSKSSATQQISYVTVTRGNIAMTISGTGNLSGDVRTITLKSGTVKKVYFNVGDSVKKGDLLYEIEDDNLNSQLEQAKINLDLAEQQLNQDTQNHNNNIANLNITSPSDGIIDSILVKEGQNVSPGAPIATIADYSHVTVKVPFNGVQIKNIKVGQKADIFLYDSFTTVTGNVEYVSEQPVPSNTVQYYYVTVGLNNPGALSDGMKVQVSIYTDNGIEKALEDSTLTVKNTVNVTAQTSGTVDKIYVSQGQSVKKGQLLIKLSSNNISDAQIQNDKLKVMQAQNNYNQILQQIDNLKIYSPIDGKILSQNIKEGDILGSSNISSNMNSSNIQSQQAGFVPILDITQLSSYENQPETAVIAGDSGYIVNLSVDETDIKNVKVGQKAQLTTDDLPGKIFTGTVSQVSQLPTIQNGVASYNVTIQVDPSEDLLLGMSMNVTITVAEKENVLLLPIQAVQTNGNRQYVILYTEDMKNQNFTNNSSSNTNNMRNLFRNNIKFVETGIHNDNFVEIVSGVQEGDKVLIPSTSSLTNTNNRNPSGFNIMGNFRPQGGFNRNMTNPGGNFQGGSYNRSMPNNSSTGR